jgi:hypothetical protein
MVTGGPVNGCRYRFDFPRGRSTESALSLLVQMPLRLQGTSRGRRHCVVSDPIFVDF